MSKLHQIYWNEYIIIYGLKNKMQTIRIFYLVGSAYATYAITYIVLWYCYGGPS